ncbi:MAG: cobaltochelatase subunit CobT [Geminicoccaceae bacterium]|nr:MAG: cobaltochelatase subunit CobT [Geminicoccaceae bacterium]
MSDPKRRLEEFQRAVAATTRALADDPALTVGFKSNDRRRGSNQAADVRLSSPRPDMHPSEIARVRGEADGLALRRRYHDAKLHGRFQPQGEVAAAIFDALEQVRCEALGCATMEGVRGNLASATAARLMGPQDGNLAQAQGDRQDEGALAQVAELYAREKLLGFKAPTMHAAVLDKWREMLDGKIGVEVHDLGDHLADQTDFALRVREMLRHLGLDEETELPPDEQMSEQQDQDQQEPPGSGEQDSDEGGSEEQGQDGERQDKGEAQTEEMGADAEQDADGDAQEAMGADMEAAEDSRQNQPQLSGLPGTASDYRVFTYEHDQIIEAEELCSQSELTRLRMQLDQSLERFQGMIGRMANRLQRKLMAQQLRSWSFDLDEGMLDTAKLSRVVTTPGQPLTFKMEKDTEFRDTVVTLLIDNSGSMRGRPIAVAAACGDILARTLERCGVKVEILGFTTRAWKGGQSREAWLRAGKPGSPGRLNDLRHIVYKNADSPWRRSRRNLGLMLREGILKENIDGEAILWSYQRLKNRPEQRKILMVISDGAPVDDSTLSANPGNYLEKHLREVIEFIETRTDVELLAIGIGHDVTRYYQRAVTISDPEQLGGAMLGKLTELFEEDRRR